jgi:PEP-CTERM motif
MNRWICALAVLGLVFGAGQVKADTIDFTQATGGIPVGTPMTSFTTGTNTVFFSLPGGPENYSNTPVTGGFGSPFDGIDNSPQTSYPTSNILQFTFANVVGGVSGNFDNLGISFSGRGDSFVQAFDSSNFLLETVALNTDSPGPFALLSSGIKTLQFNNNTGGFDSWLFSVNQITFTTQATPEPTSLALLGMGIAGMAAGYSWRRRKQVTA